MKIDNIDINNAVKNIKQLLKSDKSVSPTLKASIQLLITLVTLLFNRSNLNSSNSSKPPSTDLNTKKKERKKSSKSPGGQQGHEGTTLEPVKNPDKVQSLLVDKRSLPRGKSYKNNGYISRQVVNIKISRFVTEYRAEVLIDDEGREYVAKFPEGVSRPIQYGASVKANSTYASIYQLIPYGRIQEQFKNEYNIPISAGSIYNFNTEASNLLSALGFDTLVKRELADSPLAHADETGINVNGSKIWLHNVSNEQWTWFEPHNKRGTEAMEDIGIIPLFKGILCHDHWKPYFTYSCKHVLCNAHHLRELTRAFEQDGQKWAEKMRIFLTELNKEVDASKDHKLSKKKIKERTKTYQAILTQGNKECPATKAKPGTKRRPAQGKSRNLLERLRDYENEVLKFMFESFVPFTNNQGERDIRMTKVQQKISGCFRSMEGAAYFCRVRSFLSTCKKNGVSASEALEMVFKGKLPSFMQEKLNWC